MKKILVIEDNNELRDNICELLEFSGYDVAETRDGKEGIKRALEWLPDLIICDIMMPTLNGYGALKVLQNNPKTAHIPFIFLSAKADKRDFRKGMNLGADDYITKPFEDLELLEAIEMRINKKNNCSVTKQPNTFNVEGYYKEALAAFLKTYPSNLFPSKTILHKEGIPPQKVFFICKGTAQTFKTNDCGKELVLTLYTAGNFVGLADIFRKGPYRESAQCIEESEIMVIPKEDFLDWVRQDNTVSQYLLQTLAQETGDKDQDLLDLAYGSIRERIAAALLKLKKTYQQDSFVVRREELAHIVGTTRETITRTLSEFKKDEIIALNGSSVQILNITKLKQLRNASF